ncbi:MAG: methyltransferase domain-containing protein [Rhodospirillales bacterium]|nr:methyltransferase domain-containing protein [Rhodospirillales bacterium]
MKPALPEPDFRYSALSGLPFEALKWEFLKTAIELSLFDHLTEPVTSADIAAKLALHPANTEHLLNALVTLDCLSKSDGLFTNTQMAEKFLTTEKPMSIGHSILYVESWNQPVMNGRMKELIKNGPPPPRSLEDEKIWQDGARAILNQNRCGHAKRFAERVSALPEFPGFKRILDLGAGPGINGIAIAMEHPSLHCFLFDQPAVCTVADEVIAEYGLDDRVSTIPGDYMADPIGENYDLVLASFTLNFYRDRLDEIIGKIYRSLNPDGILLVASDGLTHEKTAPARMVVSWLPVSLQGMDVSFEQGEIADAMLRTGFVSTQTQTLDDITTDVHGPIDLIIGRKGSAA